MKHEIASEILNSDNWSAHACVGCGVRFRDSIASRPGRVDGEVDLLCRDCAYQYDTRELKLTGVMSGTSLATAAYLRRDLDTFRMFFETEVSLTPTLQAAWARYKDHPAINHPSLKRALLVNTATGELHDRTWGEEFAPDAVPVGVFVLEIFDSLCGYYGIDLRRWRQPPHRGPGPRAQWRRVVPIVSRRPCLHRRRQRGRACPPRRTRPRSRDVVRRRGRHPS